MKSIKILVILLFISVGYSFSQSIYVRKGGAVDYKSTVSTIDSMKISGANTFDIYKGGKPVYQTPLASTDSITFNPPTANDTCKYRLNTCDWVFQYIDNFDGANCTSGTDYGLNDNMAARQTYNPDLTGITWVRKSGNQNSGIAPSATYAQINRSTSSNTLTFTSSAGNTAALMLNKLIDAGTTGRYHVNFTVDPIMLDHTSTDWVSFMLDASNVKDGYVSLTEFGFTIGSNGSIQVFQNGHNKTVVGTVPAAISYDVSLDVNSCSLVATINGTKVTAVLDEAVPSSAYAYFGILHNKASKFSTIDDFVITTPYSSAPKKVVNYGYYWVDRAYGTHFNEIADFTNFNFVEYIDNTTPNTKTNVVQVRWQFWPDQTGDLRADWEFQWNNILPNLRANINKIKAIYIYDEPFWAAPILVADFNMVLNRIKADLPGIPVVSVMAYTTVNNTDEYDKPLSTPETNIAKISPDIDLVGADKYVSSANFSQITTMFDNLKAKRPTGNLFVVPNTCYLGTTSDAEVAKINWMFYKMSLGDPRITTILNFGAWTHAPVSSTKTLAAYLPITYNAQKLIGKAVTKY